MRRKNQRMVAPQAPASRGRLGGIRTIGNAHSLLIAGTFALFSAGAATLGSRPASAADATGITLDNFTTDLQSDDTALTADATNTFAITEAMGRRPLSDTADPNSARPNLFHSFFDFGLSAGETALFTQAITDGSDPISNVVSRVTGGMPSSINGTIRSDIAGADFWFINPAGVVFGDQSSIDVSRSFNASSGDFIVFEDGSSFDSLSSNPVLTISNPLDFGFLSATSGSTLSLNGVELSGADSSPLPDRFRGLYLHGRNVEVDDQSQLLSSANSPARGDITLTAGDNLSVSGGINALTKGNRRAGDLSFNATDISISNADVGTTTEARGRSGSIDVVAANTLTLTSSRLEASSRATNGGAAGSVRLVAGGDVVATETGLVAFTDSNRRITNDLDEQIVPDVSIVSSGDVTLTSSSAVSTTDGQADGGSVIVKGRNVTLIGDLQTVRREDPDQALGRGLNASSRALLDNGGAAGNVVIEGINIVLNDGARATALSAGGGNAGDVRLIASESVTSNVGIAGSSDIVFISSANQGASNYDPDERGRSGDVTIQAGTEIDLNNARVNAQRRSNRDENNDSPSSISLSVADGTLRLNRVNVLTSTLGDNDGGVLSLAATDIDLKRTTLSSFTDGAGNSGDIVIDARNSITGDRLRAEAEAGRNRTGAAGNVSISAEGDISFVQTEVVAGTQSNRINRDSEGNELRGSVSITTSGDIDLENSAVVASTLSRAAAGDIFIRGRNVTISERLEAASRFRISGEAPVLGEGVEASTKLREGRAGNGGNITVIADNLTLNDGANILSTTDGPGDAGDIQIEVREELLANQGLRVTNQNSRDTQVTISSANLALARGDNDRKLILGASGNVNVVAGTGIDLTNAEIFALRRSSNPDNTSPSTIDIMVTDGDFIASEASINSATRGANDGGTVLIDAVDIDLTNSRVNSFTTGEGNSGSVNLIARGDIKLNRSNLLAESSNSDKGAAGSINVTAAGSLNAVNSQIVAATQSDLKIPDVNQEEIRPSVTITAEGNASFTDSAVLASTLGEASAGTITINADTLSISGSRSVRSQFGDSNRLGQGISVSTLSQDENGGNAGSVNINANNIRLSNGAEITSNTAGEGDAGNVELTAAESIVVNEGLVLDSENRFDTQVLIASENAEDSNVGERNRGASGNISLWAGTGIDLHNARINVARRSSNRENANPSQIIVEVDNGTLAARQVNLLSSTFSGNDAGSVEVSATDAEFVNGRIASFTQGAGNSGSLKVSTANSLSLTNVEVLAQSTNTNRGAAGSVELLAGGQMDLIDSDIVASTASNRIRMRNGEQIRPSVRIEGLTEINIIDSAVLASTLGRAAAGSIDIVAPTVNIDGTKQVNSLFADKANLGTGISASTLGKVADVENGGNAGNVTITADNLNLTNGATITSNTGGSGNAGNINIMVAQNLRANEDLEAARADRSATEVLISSANLALQRGEDKADLGSSGNITVSAGNSMLLNNTKVSARRRSSNPDNLSPSGVKLSVINGDLVANDIDFSSATSGENNGGSLQISANSIQIEKGVMSAFTTGRGNGGSVIIDAAGDLIGNDLGIEVESSESTKGAAGSVNINTDGGVTLTDSRVVAATQSDRTIPGADGNTLTPSVTIAAGTAVTLSETAVLASALGDAPAGDISVTANDISITGSRDVASSLRNGNFLGSGVSASASAGGEAGTVNLVARNSLTLSNALVASQSLGEGAAGQINLRGESVAVGDGSEVLASTRGSAKGGQITLTGTNIELSGASTRVSSNATSTGVGGRVDIITTDLTLSNGARIETLAEGSGASGDIKIDAKGNVMLDSTETTAFDARSALLSESSISQGGSITANVVGELRVNNARIESSVSGADGKGGDINITPQALFLTSGQILARAQQGAGGAISIGRGGSAAGGSGATALAAGGDGLFLIDSNSIINADSEAGTNGVIAVDSPDISANAVIAEPDARIVSTPALNDSLCSAEAADRSSLVIVNEGGVPPAPDGYLSVEPSGPNKLLKEDGKAAFERTKQLGNPTRLAASVIAGCTLGGGE